MWIHLLSLELIDGASPAVTISGRPRRGRRRRLWWSHLYDETPTQARVARERQMVEEMLREADIDSLVNERKILRAAVEEASKRQAAAIQTMIERIDRRVQDVQEDDDLVMLLL